VLIDERKRGCDGMRKRYLAVGGEQHEWRFNPLNRVGKLVKQFDIRRIGKKLPPPAAYSEILRLWRGFDDTSFGGIFRFNCAIGWLC
jgi:hypothetical protein